MKVITLGSLIDSYLVAVEQLPGRTEMIERPAVVTPHLNGDIPQKPRLSMAWVIDPTAGKPVARWGVEPTEMTWSKSLASAA